MNARSAVTFVVSVVLVTTLLSGPLVAQVDLSPERTFAEGTPGEGEVTIEAVSAPDRATLERGDFGSESYYLRVDPATMTVRNVAGSPIVSYELSVPAFGITKSRLKVLEPGGEGRIELAMEEHTFGPNEITEDSYDAQLVVDVRRDGTEELLLRKNITVEVVG